MPDMLIKNGTVVDGTGAPAFAADVRIKDGLIAEVGSDLPSQGERIIDAKGRNNNDIHIACLKAAGVDTNVFGMQSLCQGAII